jgi:hypothetical protein
MIETGLTAYLLAQSSVTSLIGEALQPLPAPDEVEQYPCVTYQVASYQADYTASGSTGWAQKRVVYNCWATTYLQAITIREAIRTALTGYQGTLPDGTEVFLAECVNGEDYFEPGSRLYRTSLHVMVQYFE